MSEPRDAGGDLTFLTSVFGRRYLPFVTPHLHRLRTVAPAATVRLLWKDLPEIELRLLRGAFPEVSFEPAELPVAEELNRRIAGKLRFWRRACEAVTTPWIALLDCDTLLLRPLDGFTAGGRFDVLVTWKDEPWPLNIGVMLFARDAAAPFLDAWLRRLEPLLADPRALAEAVAMSGAADQHALRQMIGFVHYDGDHTRQVDGRQWRIRGVPCERLNETRCVPLGEETHVVHYKGGWHRVLLDGGGFTESRPKAECRELYELWCTTRDAAERAVAAGFVARAAERHAPRFAPLAGGYEERGILHSEMLALCAVCRELGVDAVVESGRARGQSTRMLAECLRGEPVRIVSIERHRDADARFAEERLGGYDGVELLYGDSFELLPRLLPRLGGERLALLLDGPKGRPAVELIRRCLELEPRIVAAFLHDSRRGSQARAAVEARFARVFFTDQPEYVERHGGLDAPCRTPDDAVGEHSWRPYRKGHQEIASYGPTLAVILPAAREAAPSAPGGLLARLGRSFLGRRAEPS